MRKARPDRTGEHPETHLAGYVGLMQADAYAALLDQQPQTVEALRMSVWPVASHTCVPEGIGIVIVSPPEAPRSPPSPSPHPQHR
ncbi:MAG: hypothetical protein WA418_30130 [Bradyrhizobium sp.]